MCNLFTLFNNLRCNQHMYIQVVSQYMYIQVVGQYMYVQVVSQYMYIVVVVVRPSLSTMTNDITGLNKTWCDESCCG